MTKTLFVLVAAVTLLFSGCSSVGPGTGTRDRFDYTARPEPGTPQVQPSQPQPPEAHYQAARAALIEGNMEKATLEVKLALQDNPLDAASHFLFGSLLARKGENDQAIVGFQRALAVDPTSPEALYNLGTMLLWRGEAVPASHLLENAVLIRPAHVPSYNNLAKAYFQAGLPELAVAAYEEALRLDSSNPIALKNLLLLAEAAGIKDAAATYRRRLKALGTGLAAKPAIDVGEPITLLPTWPLAASAAGSPQATPLPVIPVAEPQARPDKEADALRELLRDLPHVMVERRAGRLTLTGWTSGPRERAMLERILGKPSEVLDLTSDDTRDPQRMIEIDAVLFTMTGLNQQDVGFNFLNLINVNFNYFASDHKREGTGYAAPPSVIGAVGAVPQWGWIFAAASSYSVNIANATDNRIAVLARPHLTALSGTPARFLAGGELVYKVAGNISGDIKPYPFGTTLTVTPTLLRTPAEDGSPRVHVKVEAGRTSILALLNQDPTLPTTFTKVTVASEAVLSLGQTLILSGLNQRENHTGRSGVPVLMDIPLLKYLFSTKSTIQSDTAVIILLTPRDPAFWNELNQKARAEFVQMRRALLKARQGTEEDMRRFREHYPNWWQVPPNRFASHLFMMETSEIYRSVSGEEFTSEDLDLDLLGPRPKSKRTPK
jgi:Flp pilus assembly protein TadD